MIDIFKKKPLHFKTLEVKEFKIILEESESILIDVRTIDEVFEGKINSAINLDYFSQNFRKSIDLLDRNKPYLIYCRNGGRARKACKLMTELGFEDIAMLKGGFKAWQKEID